MDFKNITGKKLMSVLKTIARPYAQAIFELAKKNNTLEKWKAMLILINHIANYSKIRPFLSGSVSPEYLSSTFIFICGNQIDLNGINFIKLLAEKQRLNIVSFILKELIFLENTYKKIINVQLISSVVLKKNNISEIQNILKKILLKEISLVYKIDKRILGGIILTINNTVFNFSFYNHLKQLSHFLKS